MGVGIAGVGIVGVGITGVGIAVCTRIGGGHISAEVQHLVSAELQPRV